MPSFPQLLLSMDAVYEEFKTGAKKLFAIKAKGKEIADLRFADAIFQKMADGGASIVLWVNPADAERLISQRGWGASHEVCEFNLEKLMIVAKNIFGEDLKDFGYVLY